MKEHTGDLFDRIKTSKNLPSLPHILLKLIEACGREDSTIKEISHIINKDSSLTAKVLKMVNSAYYGLSHRVTSIEHALVLLGIDAVKNISISASVNQAFGQVKMNALFDLKVFWRHSLTCAVLARLISKKVSYPSPDEAFLSGLLHDIGKLVLWVNFPKEYGGILKSSKDQMDLVLAGEARHGATHCEVGAWLLDQWQLQSFMTDAILYHHESVDRIHHALPLVKIIYAANILCPEINKEESVKLGITENLLGLKGPEVEELTLQTEEEVSVIATSLDIDIE
ncbi:MAG: HDOD domain-containing protein, partial [Deltaproteobacteria bacterium]|nr:HDOD domain-containing protein [Deltaproteobacteria bacterium]